MAAKSTMKEQNINVYVRIRPDTQQEKKYGPLLVVRSQREISVKHSTYSDKKYAFDRVFDSCSSQTDIFNTIVRPLVPEVISGYNCTVFAYGQTGTGKTYTMTGEKGESEGIIPRTLTHIFNSLSTLNTESSVRLSYIELYNEELFDMLSSTDLKSIRIYEDKHQKGSVILQGVEEYTVTDKDQLHRILEMGTERRRTAATLMNAHSSRSHTVFSVIVHTRETTPEGEELVKTGKMNLVDLAGCENILRSGAVDKRAREAGSINQSLLTLGRVIKALTEKNSHVPYRESKLTRILQDSLGGRTKTSLIATISSSTLNLEETLSTLEYAMRARSIQNRPEVNQKISRTALINQYTGEIERLKKDLSAARTGNGVFLDEENYNTLMARNETQRNELMSKMNVIKNLQTQLDDKNTTLHELQDNWMTSVNVIESLKNEKQLLAKEHEHQQRKLEVFHNKTKYLENKTQKLFQNEDTLHNKLSYLYQASDSNRSVSKKFNDMYVKLNNELNDSIEKCVSFVIDSATNTSLSVLSFKAKLEECYKAIKTNLDEFNELSFKINEYKNTYFDVKNSMENRVHQHFNEMEDVMKDTHNYTSQFLCTLRKDGIEDFRISIDRISSKHDTNYKNLLSNLNHIWKTVSQASSVIANSLIDFHEPVRQELIGIIEQMDKCSEYNGNAKNTVSDVIKNIKDEFQSVIQQLGKMQHTFVEDLQMAELQQKQAIDLNGVLRSRMHNFKDVMKDKTTALGINIDSQLENIRTVTSEAENVITMIRQESSNVKTETMEQLRHSSLKMNEAKTNINKYFNKSAEQLSDHRKQIADNEQTYNNYLDSISDLCDDVQSKTQSASTILTSLYTTGSVSIDNAAEALKDATVEAGNMKEFWSSTSRNMLDQVKTFCGAELNLPTHAGDTPQKIKRRPSVLCDISFDAENINPNRIDDTIDRRLLHP